MVEAITNPAEKHALVTKAQETCLGNPKCKWRTEQAASVATRPSTWVARSQTGMGCDGSEGKKKLKRADRCSLEIMAGQSESKSFAGKHKRLTASFKGGE